MATEPPFDSRCDACGRERPTTYYPLCSLCDECIAELGITVRPEAAGEN